MSSMSPCLASFHLCGVVQGTCFLDCNNFLRVSRFATSLENESEEFQPRFVELTLIFTECEKFLFESLKYCCEVRVMICLCFSVYSDVVTEVLNTLNAL